MQKKFYNIGTIRNLGRINKDDAFKKLDILKKAEKIILLKFCIFQRWWIYFVLSNSLLKKEIDVKKFYSKKTQYLMSFKKGKQEFYSDFKDCSLFEDVTEKKEYPISKHLDVFNRDE